jgi:serine/threonine-protein kinase HipA
MKAELEVYLGDVHVGTMTQLPDARIFFSFQQAYINTDTRPTLSQSYLSQDKNLIQSTRIYRGKLSPFFSNLLPEGHLRKYIAENAKLRIEQEFRLLQLLGNDLPGAVTARSSDQLDIEPLDNVKKEKRIDSSPMFRFSLAGVQLKLSALMERDGGLTIPASGLGGDWIVKLPSPSFQSVPENEYAIMTLAGLVGITIPKTTIVPLTEISGLPEFGNLLGSYAFAVKRFDRKEGGVRIHMEDFAQVYGVFPDKKYEGVGYVNMARLVWTLTGEEGLREFVRRMVFCILIGNGDMHLKNWSFIYPDGRNPVLSPAYDLVSTIPYIPGDGLALNLVNSKDMVRCDHAIFQKMAEKAELPIHVVLETVKETTDKTRSLWASEKDHLNLPNHIADLIDRHMKTIPL